jgi:hypothetical protein
MTKKFKFKGWDWTEILKAANQELGMKLKTELEPFTTFEEEDKLLDGEVKRLFDDCMGWDGIGLKYGLTKKGKVVYNIIQRYLEVFLPNEKKIHYHYPLWVGLSKIKDPETFLKYTSVLIRFMWN